MGIGEAVTSLKVAQDLARGLIAADISIQQADLKMRIADLVDALLTARSAVADAQDEIRTLRDRVAELEAHDVDRASLVKRGNLYFIGNEGPFCMRCFDVDHKRVYLAKLNATPEFGGYRCPECKNFY